VWSTTFSSPEFIYRTPEVYVLYLAIVIFIFRDHTATAATFLSPLPLKTLVEADREDESHTNNVKLPTSFELGNSQYICEIPGFGSEVDENCFLMGYYAACDGNSLATFRDNLSVPSSRA
jgi:hypothetical protein